MRLGRQWISRLPLYGRGANEGGGGAVRGGGGGGAVMGVVVVCGHVAARGVVHFIIHQFVRVVACLMLDSV